MLPNLGYGELLIILVLILLLFGAKRIPEIARSLGQSLNAFKSGIRENPPDAGDKKSPGELEEKRP
jgi:sec-independent protein translocase protein TatA